MSKDDLNEEQFSDIFARAVEASGINPNFLFDEADTYGGIGITTPTRSIPRSSTPAGLRTSPGPLPIGAEEQLFHDWVANYGNPVSPIRSPVRTPVARRSSTPVRRTDTPPLSLINSRSISPFFSDSSLGTPPLPKTPPVGFTGVSGRNLIRRGVNARFRGGRGMPRGKRMPGTSPGGGVLPVGGRGGASPVGFSPGGGGGFSPVGGRGGASPGGFSPVGRGGASPGGFSPGGGGRPSPRGRRGGSTPRGRRGGGGGNGDDDDEDEIRENLLRRL